MSRTSEPVTNRKFVMVLVNLALVIAVVLGGSAGVSASSTSITRPTVVNVPVVARVVDGNGRAQRAATVIACPYVGAASDCTQAIRQPVGLLGFAVLSLNKATRYSVFAFVKNPSPAWECPGYPIGNDVLYISPESTNGTPQQLPLVSKFTVAKPGPYDCVTVTVTDDAGNPLPGAGVHVDGRPSGSGPADSNGTVRFKATPGVSYDIDAFVTNTGWPCPWVNPTDGTPFHFGEHRTVTAEQLLAGQTVVIHKPTAYECVTVTVTDDAGNPLQGASLLRDGEFQSGLTDANGTIRITVEPGATYDFGAFIKNAGWPCPAVDPRDGAEFHYATHRTVSAEDLLDGETLIIHKPMASNCVKVTVTDDVGNPIPHAGLFIDAGFSNGQTDANGTISVEVTPGATYAMGAFVAGTGWPCPSWVDPVNGTELHMADHRSVTAEELMAGVTFVIHHPDPSECAPVPKAEIRMVDESGAPLPAAFVGTCGYDASTPPVYPPGPTNMCSADSGWRGPDADGVIRVPIADPSLMYDITGFLSCTDGWFLFGESNNSMPGGYRFWTISGADLLANGLTFTIIGDVATCVAPIPV